MAKPRACDQCKERPAEWAVQYIAEDRPTVSTLGSHYRGFQVLRLCDKCKEDLVKQAAR
jgi:hypothetical protein